MSRKDYLKSTIANLSFEIEQRGPAHLPDLRDYQQVTYIQIERHSTEAFEPNKDNLSGQEGELAPALQ
jgi:hypothetical protein